MDDHNVRPAAPVAYERLIIKELVATGDEISIKIQGEMTEGEGKCSPTTLSEWRRAHLNTRLSDL
jgi:hypothetical protein